MINIKLNYQDIRIFYKDCKRYINYGNNGLDINAGKYYYLDQLAIIHRTDKDKIPVWMSVIKYIYNNTSLVYNQKIVNIISKMLPNKSYADKENIMFFCVIYLAMLDLESNTNYPFGSGKRIVYNSCREVLVNGMDYKRAATLYEKKSSKNMQDVNVEDGIDTIWQNYAKSGEKYGWYNGFSDDVIDDAFDGVPKATWNVD